MSTIKAEITHNSESIYAEVIIGVNNNLTVYVPDRYDLDRETVDLRFENGPTIHGLVLDRYDGYTYSSKVQG